METITETSVRKPAWEENLFSRAPESIEEALRLADLDWEVIPKKLAWLVKGKKGEPDIARTIEGWVAYINSNAQEVVSIAKEDSRSQFQTNKDSFDFVDELV